MKKNKSTIILILVFFVGLSVMLYPTLSDYVNQLHQSRAVATYAEDVDNLTDADYSAYFEAADAFNAQIAADPKVFDFSDPEACMKALDEMPLLYSTNGVDFGRDEVGAQYGALKYWPVINTQSTRQLYYGILKELRQIVKPHINSSDRRTREHYRFIYESISRLID